MSGMRTTKKRQGTNKSANKSTNNHILQIITHDNSQCQRKKPRQGTLTTQKYRRLGKLGTPKRKILKEGIYREEKKVTCNRYIETIRA